MKTLLDYLRFKSIALLALMTFSVMSISYSSNVASDEDSDILIYQENLAAGVSNWSWTNSNPQATQKAFEGSYSLYGEMNAYEGIYLTFAPPIELPSDGYLEFSIFSENTGVIAIQTSSVVVGDGTRVQIDVVGGQWQQESIALSELTTQDSIWGVWWQQFSNQTSGGVYLDNIRISSSSVEEPTGAFASAEATSRFLSRATFGATAVDINRLSGTSASDWFQQQLSQPVSGYLDSVLTELRQSGATDPSGEPTFQGRTAPNFVFWENAISAPDQLRQRMMYALSQILVISNSQSNLLFDRPTAVAAYQDILSRNALGNYRDLLEEVTYSTAMGEYLTYLQNRKGDDNGRMPDENYAREIMQLFTIGLVELNMNGEPRLENGEPVETYTNRDVTGLARVFTGMSYELEAFEPGFVPISSTSLASPMVFFPQHHEAREKTFLGTTIPAGSRGEDSITIALDTLIAHPNTPPFIARQLIQRFVSSHPSPAFVRRVATAFANGGFTLPDGSSAGTGRRGDLAATIAAILFDPEALAEPNVDTQSGKLREPVLRFTHWARAFNARELTARHVPWLWNTGSVDALYQAPFRSASVFNFYRPGYIAPGTESGAAQLTVPELQLVNASSVPGFINFMRRFVFADAQNNGDPNTASSFIPAYTQEEALADQPDALANRLNRVLAAGQLRAATLQRIVDIINTIPINEQSGVDGRRLRVMHAILMVMTSSEYTVQK